MRRSKYGVRLDRAGKDARTVDNVVFASRREAERYKELRAALRTGLIRDLQLQPRYPLYVADVKVGVFTADFRYMTASGELIVEDVKSGPTRTEAYKLRKKCFEAYYKIPVKETA